MQGFLITATGEGMLARASAGEHLSITSVMVGSGVAAGASEAKALTALIAPVAQATSSTPAVSGGQVSMLVEYRNDMNGGLDTGFDLCEFGVFASVGDDAPALLYYASLGDRPDPVQPIAEGLDIHRYPIAIAVTGDVTVTLAYPPGIFLTEEDLKSVEPTCRHAVISIRSRDPGKPDYGLGGGGETAEVSVVLLTGDHTGEAEVSALVNGREYDIENMSTESGSAPNGTLILTNMEEF